MGIRWPPAESRDSRLTRGARWLDLRQRARCRCAESTRLLHNQVSGPLGRPFHRLQGRLLDPEKPFFWMSLSVRAGG